MVELNRYHIKDLLCSLLDEVRIAYLKILDSANDSFCLSCHIMEDYRKSLRMDDRSFIPAILFKTTFEPSGRSRPNERELCITEVKDLKIEGILVPIDFSSCSLQALDYALAMVDPSGEVYLLHVIEGEFIERLSAEGFCDAEPAIDKLRMKAGAQLQKIAEDHSASGIRIESMVVIGKPYAEILRIAADLKFGLIAMGIRGRHQGGIEEILFGSTAEKVLCATRIPVICMPLAKARSSPDAT